MARYFKNKYTNAIAKCLAVKSSSEVKIQPENLRYSFTINPDAEDCSWIEVKDDMEHKINIAEILEDAPKGTKLYSPLYGDVEFGELLGSTIRVIDIRGSGQYFDEFGRPTNNLLATECLLFPSKDNRDWSVFKAPWKHKHFEPFQKVLVNVDGYWTCDIYSHRSRETIGNRNGISHERDKGHICIGNDYVIADEDILPYEGNENLLGKEVEDE